MKYFLIGYMGSGKSSLGRLLAEELNIPFYDLDTYIERQENLTIAQIFKTKGEIYFRKIEHEKLKELLAERKAMVIALGGGTPCYAGNMELLLENGKSIYLQYPLEVLVDRLWIAKEQRPLIAQLETKELLEDFIRKHLFERAPYYMQANHRIKLEYESLEEVVQKLQVLLQQG
ncbi:MAG TPA: shikimate kinase [Flavobacteriaceae bacterium]|nr:shikimate kinase [Flavobacteriaceae bacterium]